MLLVNKTKKGNTEEDNMTPPGLDSLFIIQNFTHKLSHALLCSTQRTGIADHMRMEKSV